jgi:hypothetical protein
MNGSYQEHDKLISWVHRESIPDRLSRFPLEDNVPERKTEFWERLQSINSDLEVLEKKVKQYFDQIDAVNGDVPEQTKRQFHPACIRFRDQLISTITKLKLTNLELYNQAEITSEWARQRSDLLTETKALSDYVEKICPIRQHDANTSSTESTGSPIFASLDAIQEANDNYVKAQPSLSKMQKAKQIGKLALVFGIAALAIAGAAVLIAASFGAFAPAIAIGGTSAGLALVGAGGIGTVGSFFSFAGLDMALRNPMKSEAQKQAQQLSSSACAFQSVLSQSDNTTLDVGVVDATA